MVLHRAIHDSASFDNVMCHKSLILLITSAQRQETGLQNLTLHISCENQALTLFRFERFSAKSFKAYTKGW